MIAFSRQVYKDRAMSYNPTIQRFPIVLNAGMFGFHNKIYFNLDREAAACETVQVDV